MGLPMNKGGQVGQIKTSVPAENRPAKGSGTHTFKQMPAAKGGESIKGPGTKNTYKGGA